MVRGSIFKKLKRFCFKYTIISDELILCINVFLELVTSRLGLEDRIPVLIVPISGHSLPCTLY